MENPDPSREGKKDDFVHLFQHYLSNIKVVTRADIDRLVDYANFAAKSKNQKEIISILETYILYSPKNSCINGLYAIDGLLKYLTHYYIAFIGPVLLTLVPKCYFKVEFEMRKKVLNTLNSWAERKIISPSYYETIKDTLVDGKQRKDVLNLPKPDSNKKIKNVLDLLSKLKSKKKTADKVKRENKVMERNFQVQKKFTEVNRKAEEKDDDKRPFYSNEVELPIINENNEVEMKVFQIVSCMQCKLGFLSKDKLNVHIDLHSETKASKKKYFSTWGKVQSEAEISKKIEDVLGKMRMNIEFVDEQRCIVCEEEIMKVFNSKYNVWTYSDAVKLEEKDLEKYLEMNYEGSQFLCHLKCIKTKIRDFLLKDK